MTKRIVLCLAVMAFIHAQCVSAAPLMRIALPDGQNALVDSSGIAQVWSADRRTVMYRHLRPSLEQNNRFGEPASLPSGEEITNQLRYPPARAYDPDEVLVQFRPGVGTAGNRVDLNAQTKASMRRGTVVPAYTNDAQINRTFAKLGVDRALRFAPNTYRIHVTSASVTSSVTELRASPSVAYASPNWFVSTMRMPTIPISKPALDAARTASREFPLARMAAGHELPENYAISASAQSLLNAPGVNAMGAYDEIARTFHQLPGQGEIITNVSLGDLTDASVVSKPPGPRGAPTSGKGGGGGGDPCGGIVALNGPTTIVSGGQRYLDWPSMPLIPTYVADGSGNLSGSTEVCNSPDQGLGEVGLDFSVMAPLPHQLQRPGEQGSGFTDLLGIAPGASYRLVVPSNPSPTVADIDAALLGAALQNPRPNVITASLGFGFDTYGFPGRYLEEDPLTNAIVSSIVGQYGIVVCIAANDGLRVYTNAAVAPSGGSAATDIARAGGTPSDLNDMAFSTAPSAVFDSGAIDVGGTTLNDIFAAPPQDPSNSRFMTQLAFPVTRYDGDTTFSSGFGSRVNVSAPADDIPALSHAFGSGASAVNVYLEGGTSASAPEAAAAAAVALQVARLTGHPFSSAKAVRDFLMSTGSEVPNVPQSDAPLHVGPQIDLTNAVEALLVRGGVRPSLAAARVAVWQRRSLGLFGGAFVSDTDSHAIDLQGPLDANNAPTGNNQLAWLTIAPDWEGVSSQARFSLSVAQSHGKKSVLATTRWARMLPADILRAAGLSLDSPSNRTVSLVYEANDRGRTVSVPVTLVFGPANGMSMNALAPEVASIIRGNTMRVTYDLSAVRNVTTPMIIVSLPGRINPVTGFAFYPKFVQRLSSLKGSAVIPVDKLQGDGVYGVALGLRSDPSGGTDVSDFAYPHVLSALHDTHASAPLLASGRSVPGHMLEIPFNGSFSVSWDVTNVPGATGALLEISAPGPTAHGVINPFNNPGGTMRDDDGVSFGSVYATTVAGSRGTIMLDGRNVGLVPTMNHVVRVIPLAGRTPAAEAGDVSTVSMDGVLPSDGGTLQNGYAIDETADAGFLTSVHIGDSGFDSTVETFTPSTASVRTLTESSTDLFFTTGSGLWGGNVGIAGDEDLTIAERPPSASTYRLINPASPKAMGTAWQPPVLADSVSRIVQTAPNPDTATALVLSGDPLGSSPSIPYQVFTSNLAANTFGKVFNVSAALPQGGGFAIGLAQELSTNTSYVAFANFDEQCGAPQIATVDMASGKIKLFTGAGSGFPLDIVIDQQTKKGIYQSQCDDRLNIFDLSTHATTTTPLLGVAGLYNAVDPAHHLIAVEMAKGASGTSNNNQMSAVFIYDEHGSLIKTLEKFNFYGTSLVVNANNLQLNSTRRVGYMFGPGATQLEPFNY